MARTLQWSQLKTGTIAFVGLVVLVLSILLFARVGALHGDKSDIFVLTQDAEGVLEGTEVWLSGQKVGLVKDIHFRPISTDTAQRLALHAEILNDRMHLIRRDAYADIRAGDNLIGSPIVFISSGTSNVPGLRSGDTLVNKKLGKIKPLSDKVTDLMAHLSLLADSGKKAVALLGSQAGTTGKITNEGLTKLSAATSELSSIVSKMTTGDGSAGLIYRGQVGARVSRILAQKDSINLLLNSNRGNVGRFRKDSTLFTTVAHVRSEIDSLKAMLGGKGGIQRVRGDSTITSELARARLQLTALMADIKKHPTRYISF